MKKELQLLKEAAAPSKVLIAAKTYGHASHCAKMRKLGPHEWAYVDDGHRLVGTRGAKVILYETWRYHPHYDAIERMLKERECKTEDAHG